MQTMADIEVGRVMRRIRFAMGERKRRTVSQAEFGAAVGKALELPPYAQPTVSAWEKGLTPVPGKALATALKLYGELVGRHVPYEELADLNWFCTAVEELAA